MSRSAGRTGAALLALALAGDGSARAYDQPVHELLSRAAYAGPACVAPEGRPGALAAALADRLFRAGAGAADPALRRRFLARYPTRAALDGFALKQLLGLNPDRPVAGFDATPLPAATDGASLYALASRLPDDDGRNRDRFRHDAGRHVLKGPSGEPLPDDPATLEMGALTGLSSQAHAHYGLPKLAFSDDPEVLRRDPRRFAVPPTVHTFGVDYVEAYTALAVVAASLPGGERLALVHAGAAAHHLEDLANPIHAVQVGLYDFFVDAKIQSILEELRSVGGLLRARDGFIDIGIAIIGNHHLLAEQLHRKHLLLPGDPARAIADATPADVALDVALAGARNGCTPGFGRAIAEALVERSSLDGPEVYRAVRAIAAPRLSRAGVRFDERDDPDAALRPGADPSALFSVASRGLRRADQALGAWWRHFGACAATPGAADAFALALVAARLDALDAADARAAACQPVAASTARPIAWWVPGLYAALVGGLSFAAAAFVRQRRRQRS